MRLRVPHRARARVRAGRGVEACFEGVLEPQWVIDIVRTGVNDTVNHMANVSTSAVNKESAMRKTTRASAPRRIRYNQANPVIGVRVDRPTYTRLLGVAR